MQYQNKFLKSNGIKQAWIPQEDKEAASNPFAFRSNGRIISNDYKLKIKTELCKSWVKDKRCQYGNSCAFAHGEHELQKKKHVPSRYKTKLCQQYHENFDCPYGKRCQFIHSLTLANLMQIKQNNGDIAKHVSYRQIFKENIDCLMQRLISSQNPFLNEFNLIYKDIVQRLPIFESITEITDKEEQINNEEKVQSQNYEAYDQNYSAEVRNYSTFYEQQQNGYNPMSSQH